jgi:hypothetical protein
MNPAVVAAIIAASVSVITLIGTWLRSSTASAKPAATLQRRANSKSSS